MEVDSKLPFLDILLTKKDNERIVYQVYRNKTHIDRYLHVDSHHHLAQKIDVIQTLVVKAMRVSDPNHLHNEMDHLEKVFKNNGYIVGKIKKAIRKA